MKARQNVESLVNCRSVLEMNNSQATNLSDESIHTRRAAVAMKSIKGRQNKDLWWI
jgi:hypothetical protein